MSSTRKVTNFIMALAAVMVLFIATTSVHSGETKLTAAEIKEREETPIEEFRLPDIRPNWKASRIPKITANHLITTNQLTAAEISARIREVFWMTETKKLMEEILRTLGWNLSGKTIEVDFVDFVDDTGAETLPTSISISELSAISGDTSTAAKLV